MDSGDASESSQVIRQRAVHADMSAALAGRSPGDVQENTQYTARQQARRRSSHLEPRPESDASRCTLPTYSRLRFCGDAAGTDGVACSGIWTRETRDIPGPAKTGISPHVPLLPFVVQTGSQPQSRCGVCVVRGTRTGRRAGASSNGEGVLQLDARAETAAASLGSAQFTSYIHGTSDHDSARIARSVFIMHTLLPELHLRTYSERVPTSFGLPGSQTAGAVHTDGSAGKSPRTTAVHGGYSSEGVRR